MILPLSEKGRQARQDWLDSLERHPVFSFVFSFALGFTIWSLLSILHRSTRFVPIASHILDSLVFALIFASALSLLRWHNRRGSPQSVAHVKRLLWIVAGIFILLAIVLQFI